ncbi:PQQ-binding-like beta-propeller repeat protein [Actinomadura sp. SCN-SB]|uniref:outer membrane protein assembly factor BamB family protein n=1 Tax=Actinomadura sp. SCN-SB TaxID=3373092 RepID=UPI0037522678
MTATRPGDPRKLGPYRVVGRLGAGGMGQVYLGRSPGGRGVAIKVIHPAMADEPDFRSRFRREVTAARAVNGVYTAAVLDADPDAPQPWLATAYLQGLSLQDAVAEHGPFPPHAARTLGAGLAEALVSIHRAGVVHRDLKPSNVMLTPEGPRVIDFGIARASEASALTRTGVALGTPAYMSPEQASGGTAGPPADVFSLGAVLTYAVTGVGPFGHGAVHDVIYRVLHQEPDLGRVPDPGLRSLIAACLQKDPDLRPSPEQVLHGLASGGDLASPQGTYWLPPPVARHIADQGAQPPVRGPSRRRFLVAGAAGVGCAGLMGGAVITTVLRLKGEDPVLWTFRLSDDGVLRTGPLVAAGHVYVSTSDETIAIDGRTGRRRWEGAFTAARNSSMAVLGGTGFLCDSGVQSRLTAFDLATGRPRWETPLRTRSLAPTPIVAAGAVCLAGSVDVGNSGLFAFDPATGRNRWTYRADLTTGDVAADGGVCYLADEDGFLCAIDARTGGARWRARVNDRYRTASPVAGGGLVIMETQDGGIRAFDAATGRQRWAVASVGRGGVEGLDREFTGSVMIAGGVVYVGGSRGTLSALDARTGARRWSVTRDRPSGETPSRGGYLLPALGGGLAVLSDPEGGMQGVDAATGRVRWRQMASKSHGERPLIVGSQVYQGTLDGLYGFDLATGRPTLRLDPSEEPGAGIGSAQNLAAAGGTVYCAVDSRLIYAVRPS